MADDLRTSESRDDFASATALEGLKFDYRGSAEYSVGEEIANQIAREPDCCLFLHRMRNARCSHVMIDLSLSNPSGCLKA